MTTPAKRRRPRKPRPRMPRPGRFGAVGLQLRVVDGDALYYPAVMSPTWDLEFCDAKEARRLAAWLLRFADWADAKAKPERSSGGRRR